AMVCTPEKGTDTTPCGVVRPRSGYEKVARIAGGVLEGQRLQVVIVGYALECDGHSGREHAMVISVLIADCKLVVQGLNSVQELDVGMPEMIDLKQFGHQIRLSTPQA